MKLLTTIFVLSSTFIAISEASAGCNSTFDYVFEFNDMCTTNVCVDYTGCMTIDVSCDGGGGSSEGNCPPIGN